MSVPSSKYMVSLPIYDVYTKVLYFPSATPKLEVCHSISLLDFNLNFNLQDSCNFFLLSNELKPLSLTGTSILLPYLPGHDYVLLKSPGSGVPRSTYQ